MSVKYQANQNCWKGATCSYPSFKLDKLSIQQIIYYMLVLKLGPFQLSYNQKKWVSDHSVEIMWIVFVLRYFTSVLDRHRTRIGQEYNCRHYAMTNMFLIIGHISWTWADIWMPLKSTLHINMHMYVLYQNEA